jgi:hypothetical protein
LGTLVSSSFAVDSAMIFRVGNVEVTGRPSALRKLLRDFPNQSETSPLITVCGIFFADYTAIQQALPVLTTPRGMAVHLLVLHVVRHHRAHDHAFDSLEQWLLGRKIFNDATSFRAYSVFEKNSGASSQGQVEARYSRPQGWGDENDGYDGWGNHLSEVDMSNDKFEYEPRCGHQFIFYKIKIIFVEQNAGERRKITLTCLGRSVGTVKEILSEASRLYTHSGSLVTVVRRANSGSWSQTSSKAQCSVDSVSIDSVQKARLLADLDEYVAPRTAAWYGARGIPYRRGYLFYGSPGTGKSSLARAVAARYKRDIYTVSLLDPVMSDSLLLRLLNEVPNHSIVLFEDADSADLAREFKDQSVASLEKATGRRKTRSQVTLSGLLNATDGVESPEGHILIMTTNRLEELDEALIRSGRISVRIGFRLISPAQAKEVFIRMMQEDVYVGTSEDAILQVDSPEAQMLTRLAGEFAKNIPDNTFSPADLQDYLLMHKREPRRAVEELEGWKKSKQREQEEWKRREEEKFKRTLFIEQEQQQRDERLEQEQRRRNERLEGE